MFGVSVRGWRITMGYKNVLVYFDDMRYIVCVNRRKIVEHSMR